MLQIFVKKIKEYFSVLYSALSEIVNREMAPTIPSEDTIKICEYCFLEILKLKDRVDQKETDSVVMSIYSRWTKVKNEIAKNLQELPNHSREPIVFKVSPQNFCFYLTDT